MVWQAEWRGHSTRWWIEVKDGVVDRENGGQYGVVGQGRGGVIDRQEGRQHVVVGRGKSIANNRAKGTQY